MTDLSGSRLVDRLAREVRRRVPLAVRPVPSRERLAPTWRDARPTRIARSLDRALARDPGGWLVVGASRDLPRAPRRGRRSLAVTAAGREIVVWRAADGRLLAGPGACPHLGALLHDCEVIGDDVVCAWHGLALGEAGFGSWATLPAHDDGVLLWVRLPLPGESPLDAPRLPARPDPRTSIAAVVAAPATCEPRDILANRLDPWHGAWFHPYAFSHLRVDEDASDDDTLVLDVTFRLGRRVGVPVRAQFACPDARTIVMTILSGEGAGSVVETHATPLAADECGRLRTMMTEATIATSDRAGFALARSFAPLVRPAIAATQARLWVDDLAYAQRTYELRARSGERPNTSDGPTPRAQPTATAAAHQIGTALP